MSEILVALCVVLSTLITILFIVFMCVWDTHIYMNKRKDKPYDWCTFKTFKKEFDKYKDNPELEKAAFDGNSIFLRKDGFHYLVYLHADIVMFNEKCMILYPHSYLAYNIWKHHFNKQKNRQKGLWK